MVPIYKYLLQGDFNLKILVYSGDDDGVCGTIGTQKWIWNLGNQLQVTSLPEEDEWQPYLFHGQLAGYFTIWRQIRLGFVTIRGAGHEVSYTLHIIHFSHISHGRLLFSFVVVLLLCRCQLINQRCHWISGLDIFWETGLERGRASPDDERGRREGEGEEELCIEII
jgi:hypothetical protein